MKKLLLALLMLSSTTAWSTGAVGTLGSGCLTVAGVTFYDCGANLIQLSCTSNASYCTFRTTNGTGGYQVPAGKTLRIRVFMGQGSAANAVSTYLMYGSTDIGMNYGGSYSTGAPDFRVDSYGSTLTAIVNPVAYTYYANPTNFTVPTGKYPGVGIGMSGNFIAYGVLE